MGRKLSTLEARAAAHQSWANTDDRAARTANGRNAFQQKFLAEAGGDPRRAESLRKALYARLALASVKARRRRSGAAPKLTAAQRAKLAALLADDDEPKPKRRSKTLGAGAVG